MSHAIQLTSILVAVDFDESSAAALEMAAALARTLGASLTVLHAHTAAVPAYFTGAQVDEIEVERDQGRARCVSDLQAFAARYTSAPPAIRVEEGPPASTIVRLAPEFDLVVVGTRRLHGARRWWLGSVAETVVRESGVPVLVVPTVTERT